MSVRRPEIPLRARETHETMAVGKQEKGLTSWRKKMCL